MLSCHLCLLISCYSLVFWVLIVHFVDCLVSICFTLKANKLKHWVMICMYFGENYCCRHQDEWSLKLWTDCDLLPVSCSTMSGAHALISDIYWVRLQAWSPCRAALCYKHKPVSDILDRFRDRKWNTFFLWRTNTI